MDAISPQVSLPNSQRFQRNRRFTVKHDFPVSQKPSVRFQSLFHRKRPDFCVQPVGSCFKTVTIQIKKTKKSSLIFSGQKKTENAVKTLLSMPESPDFHQKSRFLIVTICILSNFQLSFNSVFTWLYCDYDWFLLVLSAKVVINSD